MIRILGMFLAVIISTCIVFGSEVITDSQEVDLDVSPLKINTQTRNDVINADQPDVEIKSSDIKTGNNQYYNNEKAYSKKSASYKKEKKYKNIDVGAQYDATFNPDKASQTETLYSKIHMGEKASINTSYSTNSLNNSSNMNGTISVTPEYRFNKHLSVQNKFSKNTSNGMSKEEVFVKVNPFKDTDRMDLDVGVGQVQYTNGSPSSSQINFGTNFKF